VYYQVTDSPALPKPAQGTQLPVIIGGGGKRRTPALAAQYADEFNAAFRSAQSAAKLFAGVRSACEAIGRDPDAIDLSAAHTVCCGSSEAELARRAEAMGRDLGELRENGLAGTPSELVEKIAAFAEAGATKMYLQVLDLNDLDHLELIASEVLPQVLSQAEKCCGPSRRSSGTTTCARRCWPRLRRADATPRCSTPR
jgi:alkanesulfonate monooxygenase SsuD/methylene tetrahydromethanopterin reductase-like flavin-dependent oxidoreductase (luciferase family)